MAGLRQCLKLGQASLRRFSTNRSLKSSLNPEEHPFYKNLKAKQELFQREDLVEEVFLKGGMKDVVVYKLVLGLTLVGLGLNVRAVYILATDT